MPSPFPGMDPYLEGYLWPDVHSALANKIRQLLTPRLKPRYVARLEISVIPDTDPSTEIGIMYPDVEIIKPKQSQEVSPPSSGMAETTDVAAPPITEPVTLTRPGFATKIITVEIQDVAKNKLVTSIEILSPVNKREPGLTSYRRKREQLGQAGVHLLEIDLIRRGERPLNFYPHLPQADYLVTLTQAFENKLQVWPITLLEKLPVVAVPLLPPDADVPLELGAALTAIYDEAAYELSIDYTQSPPPPNITPDVLETIKELP